MFCNFYSIDSGNESISHLSSHDGVVGADGDEDHVVDLREEEGGVVDVALQENLKRGGKYGFPLITFQITIHS